MTPWAVPMVANVPPACIWGCWQDTLDVGSPKAAYALARRPRRARPCGTDRNDVDALQQSLCPHNGADGTRKLEWSRRAALMLSSTVALRQPSHICHCCSALPAGL